MKSSITQPAALNATLASTTSQVYDLDGVQHASVQVNYSDAAPAAKTFTSLTKASKAVQDITYTAKTGGTAGNSITVAYVAGGTAGSEVVTVTGNAISVSLETGVSTATQVKAAIDASVEACALVDNSITGTGSTAQIAAVAAALTGGLATTLNLTANTMTISNHGYVTGTKIALTTAGVLPTGLSAQDYWVIKDSANVIRLATSLANAVAGTAVDISAEGSGTHTITPATSANNVFKLQKSIDGVNFADVSSASVTIATSSGTSVFDLTNISYRYLRLLFTPSAGQITLATYVNQVA